MPKNQRFRDPLYKGRFHPNSLISGHSCTDCAGTLRERFDMLLSGLPLVCRRVGESTSLLY